MLESDLARVVATTTSLVTLGLLMGLSPTLYAAELRLLIRSGRATTDVVRHLAAGLAAGATLLLALFQVVDPATIEALLRGRVERALVERWVDLTAGALFLGAALWTWRSRHRPRKEKEDQVAAAPRPDRMFVLGLTSTVLSLSSVPTMYLTARTVRAASPDDAVRVAAYVVFLVALVGPYLLASWAWSRLPRAAREVTHGYTWLLARDLKPWVALALGLVGAGLVVAGLRSTPP